MDELGGRFERRVFEALGHVRGQELAEPLTHTHKHSSQMLLRCLRWIRAKVTQKAERLLLRVLSVGPIPKHVAFVMDGNRRYARSHRRAIHEGHGEGFVALRRVRLVVHFILFQGNSRTTGKDARSLSASRNPLCLRLRVRDG
jgi:hypothetical protein